MASDDADPRRVSDLVEHFFRHEAGRLVASLTRLFGWRNFAMIEDMVQESLIEAMHTWSVHGVPDNPAAWMRRIAKNRILDTLRRDRVGQRVGQEWAQQRALEQDIDDALLDTGIADSQLRMMFTCCHPRLPRPDQVALILKTLCGFSTREVARALLLSEEAAKKRIQRAIQALDEHGIAFETPRSDELAERLDTVHRVLYLLFNEGYSPSSGDAAIRADLCSEAARLGQILCAHACSDPATHALMALMLLHAARIGGRTGGEGELLFLEEQDRRHWDRELIRQAQIYLGQSAVGERMSTFHLEAAIAWHHCNAASFADTDWPAIIRLYEALIACDGSPIYQLNHAVALAQVEGPRAGIQALEGIAPDGPLRHYHLFDAVVGDLHRRAGDLELARSHLQQARRKAASAADCALIDRRLAQCQ